VLANLIGVKIFALEDTLGLAPFEWSLFGQSGSLSFTAGVLVWPLIFVLTDLVNEFYGQRGVRFISLLSVGLILFETSRIVNGGETNYVLATVGLFVSAFNLFTSLLSLFGLGSND